MTLKKAFFDLSFRSQITDLKRRKNYHGKEVDSIILKSCEAALRLSPAVDCPAVDFQALNTPRTFIENRLQKLKSKAFSRVRNRCIVSGRASTLSKFRVSRIAFREMAGAGKLFGVTKRLNK